MSLLLDARKKVELALQHGNAHASTETQPTGELNINGLSAGVSKKNPDAPSHTTQHIAPVSDPRTTGKNLFAAKTAPVHTGRRPGIIPIAILSGLVLAAGGGYYVWREISPPPIQRQKSTAPPTIPVASTSPPVAPVTQTIPAPAAPVAPTISAAPTKNVPAENKPAPATVSMKQDNHAPKVDTPPTSSTATHNTAAQPIHIKQVQDSDAVDPTLLAAYEAYRSGAFDTAWQRYSEVLRKDAQNHNTPNRDALLGMAAIAQQQSQDSTAASYYRQVLMLDPRDPVANAGMSSLFGTNNVPGAESRLKLLIAQQPPASTHSASLHFALGNLYAEQSRWGDAQQAYSNACNLEPGNAQFAFNLAVSLDHLGQGKLAAQYYQRALQLDLSGNPGFGRAQAQQRINELTAR